MMTHISGFSQINAHSELNKSPVKHRAATLSHRESATLSNVLKKHYWKIRKDTDTVLSCAAVSGLSLYDQVPAVMPGVVSKRFNSDVCEDALFILYPSRLRRDNLIQEV